MNSYADKMTLAEIDIALVRFVLNGLKEREPALSVEGLSFSKIILDAPKYQQGTAEDPLYYYYLVRLKHIADRYLEVRVVCRVRVLTETNDVLPYVNGYFLPHASEDLILKMNMATHEFISVI